MNFKDFFRPFKLIYKQIFKPLHYFSSTSFNFQQPTDFQYFNKLIKITAQKSIKLPFTKCLIESKSVFNIYRNINVGRGSNDIIWKACTSPFNCISFNHFCTLCLTHFLCHKSKILHMEIVFNISRSR